jgi:hypothetical protein
VGVGVEEDMCAAIFVRWYTTKGQGRCGAENMERGTGTAAH